MKKIILLILFLNITVFADIRADKQTVENINLIENRVMDAKGELMNLFNNENKENLDTTIHSITIPRVLYTDINCGGITADFGEVMDVLLKSLKSVIASIPNWILQETLGMPNLNNPGAMVKYATTLMVEGYCYVETFGLQVVQNASEGPLDYMNRSMTTFETEIENSQHGVSLINGATPHTSSGQHSVQTPGLNAAAPIKSSAEATNVASRELYSKAAKCIIEKRKFIADVLDMKVKRFTPLAHQKQKLFKSACEIIKEKGKDYDLNNKLNIPRKLYSPILWKATSYEDLIQLEAGLLTIKAQGDSNVLMTRLNKDKVNDFFKNNVKLIPYKEDGNYVKNTETVDVANAVLNLLTKCLNTPEDNFCQQLSIDKNFIIDFRKPPDEVEGIQNILLRKKQVCEIFYGYVGYENKLAYSIKRMLENTDIKKESDYDYKTILNNYILGQFCSTNFDREIDETEKYLNNLVKNEREKASVDYAKVLAQLKAYSHLNSFFVSKETDGIQKGEKLLGVCAYYEGKPDDIKIHYWTENGKYVSEGKDAKEKLERKFNVEIDNLPTVTDVIYDGEACDYDMNSERFKKLYNNYLEGTKKQAQVINPLTPEQWKAQLVKERENRIVKIQRINGYVADLRASVLANILEKYVLQTIIKLKM